MRAQFKWLCYTLILITLIIVNSQRQIYETWMRFKLRNETIVVTFSTTPYRIDNIQPTIKTILAQSIKPQAIYLNVPYIFKRDNLHYTIPHWLSAESRLTILRTQDYGPATKLLGAIKSVDLPPDTIIITLDDDVAYPSNIVLQLAYKAYLNPGKAITICGADIDYDANMQIKQTSKAGINKRTKPDSYVAIAQGFAGVAYRRSFFDQDIFNIESSPPECINSDDVYISFYLAKHNVPRQVLNNKYINYNNIDYKNDIGLSSDALHRLESSTTNKHRICLEYLKNLNPEVIF